MNFENYIDHRTKQVSINLMRNVLYLSIALCSATDIKGRHVVILEDIFDTGNSLDFTVKHLLTKEPASLKICTLLDKPERRKPGITLQADYTGFTIPNAFVVGYGLDYAEMYRNLPDIGVLAPRIYENK